MADIDAPEPALRALHGALAQKVLHGWAQNRQQVLVPLTVNLGRLAPEARGLVVQAMAAALASRGSAPDGAARLHAALARIGGASDALPDTPPDLFALVAALDGAALGAAAYAAAALVLDRRNAGERAFLDWMAARFGLPDSLTAGLARRYRR